MYNDLHVCLNNMYNGGVRYWDDWGCNTDGPYRRNEKLYTAERKVVWVRDEIALLRMNAEQL